MMAVSVINVHHRYVCGIKGEINRTNYKYIFKEFLMLTGDISLLFLNSNSYFVLQVIGCLEELIIIQMMP